MSYQSFIVNSVILRSNNIDYQENKKKKIIIKNKIGEGSYGLVFLIQNDHVIKIFKNSTHDTAILNESNYLLPIKNENRELIFFLKYINNQIEKKYIINLYAIGLTSDIIIDNNIKLDINSYFIILPLCIPFYTTFNILNVPLINKTNGINFTLNVMKKLVEISLFLENKYNLINLDFKLNNFMFNKKTNNLNDLIMIDLSIVKKKSFKKKYDNEIKYYIWPDENPQILEHIPSYSICINGLELLFGYDEIKLFPNKNKIIKLLKIIELKNNNVYYIFYNGLILKSNTKKFLELFFENS